MSPPRRHSGFPDLQSLPDYLKLLHFFDETNWRDAPFGHGLTELRLLYVDRSQGPRVSAALNVHEWWEFTVVLRGTIRLWGDHEYLLPPGAVCLIPAGSRHQESAPAADVETFWVGFTVSETLRKALPAKGGFVTNPALTAGFEQLWALGRSHRQGIGPELDALTARALAWFYRLQREPPAPASADWLEHVILQFEEHFAEPLQIRTIARHYGCSQEHFSRLFKRRTGQTPVLYLTRARIRQAQLLLQQTDLSVAEIAPRIGYKDPFYFSRVFTKIVGRSPRAFRVAACAS